MHKIIFTFSNVSSDNVVTLVDAITDASISATKKIGSRIKMNVTLSHEEPTIPEPEVSSTFSRYMTSTTPEGRDKNG